MKLFDYETQYDKIKAGMKTTSDLEMRLHLRRAVMLYACGMSLLLLNMVIWPMVPWVRFVTGCFYGYNALMLKTVLDCQTVCDERLATDWKERQDRVDGE